jgi:hypothetical protein
MEEAESIKSTTQLSNGAKNYLLETVKWAKLLSIIGFILIGFIMVAAIFMAIAINTLENTAAALEANPYSDLFFQNGNLFSGVLFVIYILLSLLYFFPTLYLFRFASETKKGILNNQHYNIDQGFKNLKSVFKFWGIFTIITLGFYAIMFLFGFLSALMF